MWLNVLGKLPAHSYPVADICIIDEIRILVSWNKAASVRADTAVRFIVRYVIFYFTYTILSKLFGAWGLLSSE